MITDLEYAAEYRKVHSVPVIHRDDPNIVLWVIDMQYDFSDPGGTLYVGQPDGGPGAIHDVLNMARFIYVNMGNFKRIVLTADSHRLTMVSTPHFLVSQDGVHPQPFQPFTVSDFESGRWMVNPTIVPLLPGGKSEKFINEFLAYYCNKLEELQRPQLRTWPEHCPTAAPGQQIDPKVYRAIKMHEYVRGGLNPVMTKGESPFLECFSAVGPDIFFFQDGTPIPLARSNEELLTMSQEADAHIIGGEASSHCVPATLERLLLENPGMGEKTYVLEDAMSPVTGHELLAEQAKVWFINQGVNYVRTTDPMESWPGIMPRLLRR